MVAKLPGFTSEARPVLEGNPELVSAPQSTARAAWRLKLQRVAVVAMFGLAFVWFLPAGDPLQAPRALFAAAALGLLVIASSDLRRVADPRARVTGLALFILLILMSASALASGFASGVWGIHGRFEGLVFWHLLACAGLGGWLAGLRVSARWVYRVAAAAGSAQALVILYQVANGMAAVGSNSNQVMTGAWLAVCAALTIAGCMLERGSLRWWLGAAAALSVVALGAVGSRGAWVGLAFGLVPLAWARRRSWKVVLPVFALALMFVIVGAAVAGGDSLGKLDPRNLFASSASARASIWSGTLDLIADQPLLGVGPGRFLYAFPQYESLEHAQLEPDVRADQAHSHLLQLSAEGGVIAGVTWLALVVAVGSAAVAAIRVKDAAALVLAAGFAAYVGQGLFGIFAVETDVLGWVIGGMVLARARASDEQGSAAEHRAFSAALVGVLALLALASGYYVMADTVYGRGLDAFAMGDMNGAMEAHGRASRLNPLVDTYRVAHSDAAMYAASMSGSPTPLAASDGLLQSGLQLEPQSYDLALAAARVADSAGIDIDEIADRYERAAELYPMGITVRQEAIPVLLEAGRESAALEMASDVLAVSPQDPTASALIGESPQ